MTTWFSADTHFGHTNVIKLCQRPFAHVDEMDAQMMAQWNGVVQPKDTVYHLGDFAYRSARHPGDYLKKLNGIKHLVHGNHDNDAVKKLAGWSTSQPIAHVKIEGIQITLLHYAMRVWPASHYGSLHLYGHSHGRLPGDRQSLDVGVDCWNFQPVSLAEIQDRLLTLPERYSRRDEAT